MIPEEQRWRCSRPEGLTLSTANNDFKRLKRHGKRIDKIKRGVGKDTGLYSLVQSRALSLVAGEPGEDVPVVPAPERR